MRAGIRAVAPGAKEELNWGMSSFSCRRILLVYAVFKKHDGFFPTPSAVRFFAKQVRGFKIAK